MTTVKGLTAGKAARAAGVGVETLRFYEREGILAPSTRTPSGYRVYDQAAIDRLHFIQRAQALGFTLREIRELIALDSDPNAECGDLRERATRKLDVVEKKISELERIRNGLAVLLDSCDAGQPLRDCPMMRCLTHSC